MSNDGGIMTASHIALEIADGVQVLRFDRPEKKNALTDAMYGALCEALEAGDKNSDVRVHLFAGSPGAFCAGNDIGDFLVAAQGHDLNSANVFRFIRLLPRVAKPMVAVVDGVAVGIGTTMLFHCDLVYASDRSTFSTPFLDLGLVPEAASSLIMPWRMGYARAFEMLVLGEMYDAGRMKDAGAINAILPPGDVERHALEMARRLAKKPKNALKLARAMMRPDLSAIAKRIEEEAEAFGACLSSPEARAAFEAFLRR